MPTTKKGKRHTVACKIYATACYPKIGSPKAVTAQFVNFVLDPENAKLLGDALADGADGASRVTVRCKRKPAKKSGLCSISVTFANKDKK